MMKKFKFNLFDICIILILVAVVFGAVKYVRGTGRVGSGTPGGSEVLFTVQITEVDEDFTTLISEGDFVRFGNYEAGEENSGEVVGVQTAQCTRHVKNTVDGGYSEAPVEGMYDMAVTVKGTGVLDRDVVKIGTTKIRTGEIFYGKSLGNKSGKPYKIEGYIIDVDYNG